LDKETGLVWQKNPDSVKWQWSDACANCYMLDLGGRMGWRLPTIAELSSLVDPSQSNPPLPPGHPFTNVKSDYYWSSTTWEVNPDYAWRLLFTDGLVYPDPKGKEYYNLCVRGGHGLDGR
jgi:hypothetical protein